MEVTRSHKTLRVAAVVAVAALALLLSGCGISQRKVLTGVTQKILSDGQEPYFNVGGITYQVQESRQLNPFSDDVQYFYGVKDAQSLPGSNYWYGVFLWAKNQNTQYVRDASKFVLTDSAGNDYQPTYLKPNLNPFAWNPQSLAQNQVVPDPDSIAGISGNDGDLILFDLPESTYQNRPLTLHIYAPGASTASAVSLDL